MEQNRELRDNPTLTCSINLQQRRQEQTIEKTVSLINCVGKIGPLHAKKSNWTTVSQHIEKQTQNGLRTEI